MIIKDKSEEFASYLEDASNFRSGQADKLFVPENETEILEVVKYCVDRHLPLTVSGGGTGTVGGRIPVEGAILSLEKLNCIKAVNPGTRTACLEAGVLINDFLNTLQTQGLFYPPFPTERSAFIGGNIATNASGEYSFRFGSTRKYIRKIRVILTTGETVEIKRGEVFEQAGQLKVNGLLVPLPSYRTPPIKCTAGYYSASGMDVIDLLIGSEGTLGIITEAEVELIDQLPGRFIMVMFLPGDGKLLELVQLVKGRTDLQVYTLEYFDPGALGFLKADFPEIPDKTFAVYVEAASGTDKMEEWLKITEDFKVVDALIGEDPKNYQRLIDFRHKLPENVNAYFKKIGSTKVAADIAVPEKAFAELYWFYRKIMEEGPLQTILFGHIGENHLHFNFFPKSEEEKARAYQLYEACVRKGVSLAGTVSAEHGIGKIKHRWLQIMYGETGVQEMAQIKRLFDPACILNLDNIFPRELLS